MKVMDILTAECVRSPLHAADKQGVIDELVDLLAEHGRVGDPDSLKQAVWAREQTRTTGIGHGLAIPHGKSNGVGDVVMAVGRPADSLDFEAIDGKPVHLVVLLASPVDRTRDHVQALARISKLMTPEQFRRDVYDTNDPAAIFELLKGQDDSV